ncbi:DUF4352 domain-containing protein [Streptomyces sp. RPT161]|uniref:DUF4352 domain-containing protein n=1 Tax=Streptomyces sp. RPT161 TaxID=3015993 RepID=UPI0022B92063|nr:DUF4352 domain-containing protein [Streptomyces sp. RPT161]
MSRRLAASTITIAALATALTACGSTGTTITSTPYSGAATNSSPAKPSTPAKTATVGDALTLTGQNPGEKLTITLTKWSTNVASSDGMESPDPGKTWVAAQIQIVNSGSNTYSDSPDNCVQAADSSGQRFPATIVNSITNGPMMTSDLKLAPGDKGLGWVVFQVPSGSKVASVQYTPDSGMSNSTGQWAIK